MRSKSRRVVLYWMSGVTAFFSYLAEAVAQAVPVVPVEPKETVATEILLWVVTALVAVATPLVIWLLAKVVRYFEAKLKLDIPAKWEDQFMTWGTRAVQYAEEKAREFARINGRKLEWTEKKEAAGHWILDLAKKYKLDQAAIDKLTSYVYVALGEQRSAGLLPPQPEPVLGGTIATPIQPSGGYRGLQPNQDIFPGLGKPPPPKGG